MKKNYSNYLISYLFNEIDPEIKADLESALQSDKELLEELNALKDSLHILTKEKPLGPSPQSIQAILDATVSEGELSATD